MIKRIIMFVFSDIHVNMFWAAASPGTYFPKGFSAELSNFSEESDNSALDHSTPRLKNLYGSAFAIELWTCSKQLSDIHNVTVTVDLKMCIHIYIQLCSVFIVALFFKVSDLTVESIVDLVQSESHTFSCEVHF